jgi:CRISPR-associated protein Csy1
VGKYTHPNTKVSILAKQSDIKPGYLYFSSFESDLRDYNADNAANIPYPKTLEALMPDGKTVREHLESNSLELKALADVDPKEFESWRTDFEKYKKESTQSDHTEEKIKQIFFPKDDGEYALLSLIPCSILIWELKNRVGNREWEVRNCDEKSKNVRKSFIKKIQYKYGGTKPQNISFINSEKGGNAIKLKSFPPFFERKYKLPIKNFFNQLRVYIPRNNKTSGTFIWQLFDSLYRTLVSDPNALWARKKKQGILRAIIEHGVIAPAEDIRMNSDPGWSRKKAYASLPVAQKKWLDPEGHNEPAEDILAWQDIIAKQIARYIQSTFEKTIKFDSHKQNIPFDEAFFNEVAQIAREYLDE